MAAPEITELQLGKFLQIAYSEGIRTQISQDYQDWEYIHPLTISAMLPGTGS